ncbi:MAG: sulfotransferase [Pseudomonadota bacterium]
MKLPHEFIRLPLRFDASQLQHEIAQFSDSDWDTHPQGFEGNTALILVSSEGGRNNRYTGPMEATPHLERCPYIRQVLAAFGSVIGRSRLMRLEPGCQVRPHCDIDYSWRHRVRIHIPIVTDSEVSFESIGHSTVNMAEGEAWIFDNWKEHAVYNRGASRRVHLVVDTTGSAAFWQQVDESLAHGQNGALKHVAYDASASPTLEYERFNSVAVRTPNDVDALLDDFTQEPTRCGITQSPKFIAASSAFRHDWRSAWSRYGDLQEGISTYQTLIRDFEATVESMLDGATFSANGSSVRTVLHSWLSTLNDDRLLMARGSNEAGALMSSSLFDRPVFIVAAPRSGSTLLFELMRQNIEFWTTGDESHVEIESIRTLHPAARHFDSNALGRENATPGVVDALIRRFLGNLKNARGTLFADIPAETRLAQCRFLEKTPKNALRIPFLRAVFPDARFIFLHRNPQQSVASIMEAWQSGRFVTYPNLPGWHGLPWSLLLPEGWRALADHPMADIAAFQWASANRQILSDLADLPADAWCSVSYSQLVSDKATTVERLCSFADVPFGPRMQALASEKSPLSQYTVSPPDPNKWKRYETEINRVMPGLQSVVDDLAQLRPACD